MAFLTGPTPLAIAHRGGAYAGLENSFEAFARCVELGYRHLETDVHLTADGVVVAVHDRDLARVADRPGRIREMTWTQVAAARIRGTGTIPRLVDLLDAWPAVNLNIDAKVPEVVDALVRVVRDQGAEGRVCLTSFSDRRVARMRALLPGVTTALGPREIAVLRMASYAGRRTGLLGLAGQCAQVPTKVGRRTLVDRRFVQTAHRLDKQVHVWTVDDPVEMRRLLSLGVDGIMTDRPEVLKDVLVEAGSWREPDD